VAGNIDQPVACLATLTDALPDRNLLLAVLLRELGDVLHGFAVTGFAALRGEWESSHALQNRPVELSLPDGSKVHGTARGVSDDGALQVETSQGMRIFNAGEISLRKRAGHAAD
jgi:BirA family biotin operon repressor/biotin-[acetyl-CoA-carboxylase] ligase